MVVPKYTDMSVTQGQMNRASIENRTYYSVVIISETRLLINTPYRNAHAWAKGFLLSRVVSLALTTSGNSVFVILCYDNGKCS